MSHIKNIIMQNILWPFEKRSNDIKRYHFNVNNSIFNGSIYKYENWAKVSNEHLVRTEIIIIECTKM